MGMVLGLRDLALPLLRKYGLNYAWSTRESPPMPTPSWSPPTALLQKSHDATMLHLLRCSVINSLTSGSP